MTWTGRTFYFCTNKHHCEHLIYKMVRNQQNIGLIYVWLEEVNVAKQWNDDKWNIGCSSLDEPNSA